MLSNQEINEEFLLKKIEQAKKLLQNCYGCAWKCQIDRTAGELGVCKTGANAIISSYGAYFGEESVLSGWRGSGTIFFSRCNMKCVYCQNYEISQSGNGKIVTSSELASVIIYLQQQGCHNINLVSPSHVVPQIIESVSTAILNGLNIPIVYNTGGYDSIEALRLLEGIVDIYMPDMKYSDSSIAQKYSLVPDYAKINQTAVKEMHRQVGDLIVNKNGIAAKGLLIRHLVLPNGIAGSEEIIKFITEEISPNTYVNIMDQYRPCYKADHYELINRKITNLEYKGVLNFAYNAGLTQMESIH